MKIWSLIAAISAFILPLWNIPLIYRILKRKSSEDYSVSWAVGVWICFALMAPAGFTSTDIAFKVLNIMTMIFFTFVVICVLAYRKPQKKENSHA